MTPPTTKVAEHLTFHGPQYIAFAVLVYSIAFYIFARAIKVLADILRNRP